MLWPGVDPDRDNNVVTAETTFAPDDWGDAPAPYATLASDNGASHGFSALFLGTSVAVDVDGQPSAGADGDDVDGTPDEDGVVFTAPVVVGETGNLQITASAAGWLDAWVDWNRDGDWQAGEKALDGVAVGPGVNVVPLSVPMDALLGQTYARFRLSSTGMATATGRAVDGEVEDYALAGGLHWFDGHGDRVARPDSRGGGDVTFTVRVTNTGSQVAILAGLVDDHIGDLNGEGSCALPRPWPPVRSTNVPILST